MDRSWTYLGHIPCHIIYNCFILYVHLAFIFVPHLYNACRTWKKVLDNLKVELKMVMAQCVCSGNCTLILWRDSLPSWLLSISFSSYQYHIYIYSPSASWTKISLIWFIIFHVRDYPVKAKLGSGDHLLLLFCWAQNIQKKISQCIFLYWML